MAKKLIKVEEPEVNNIISSLVSDLNKSFNKELGGEDASFLLDDPTLFAKVTDYVSSGLDILDIAMSNRKGGGYPSGRIVEITGLEGCVHPDTLVKVKLSEIEKEIPISEIENLLKDNRLVTIKTLDDEFAPVTQYIKKGNLKTFKVVTENEFEILVSAEHKFLTNAGWVMTQDLILSKHLILTELGYSNIKSIEYVGFGEIVDITVDHPEHCYYGNGMMNHNSGKSLLAAYALKDTQKKGGVAVYIDTENAVSVEYMEAIGIDSSKLMYVPLNHIEDVFEAIERIIVKVRMSDKKIPVTIVVDSVMATTTKIEAAAGYDKDGYATQKALILSKGLRKITRMLGSEKILLIFTNQLRANVGAIGFGAEKWVTSGGKAIAFHSTIRLRLISEGKIKKKVNGIDNVVGIKTACKVIKNRLGPPLKMVKFDIFYESGVDNYGSWLTTLKDFSLVRQSGASYTLNFPEMKIVDSDGVETTMSELKFQSKDFKGIMMRNPELKEHIYNQVCDQYIMTYKNGDDYGIDDVEIADDDDD